MRPLWLLRGVCGGGGGGGQGGDVLVAAGGGLRAAVLLQLSCPPFPTSVGHTPVQHPEAA